MLSKAGIGRNDIAAWVWHAGGRDVLLALRNRLGLTEEHTRYSAAIVREFGNLRSAFVYFGLEAARGLQVQGCDVTVVHIAPTLMERQLDATGGSYLRDKLHALGVRTMLERQTKAILGNGHVTGVAFADGSEVEADLVVVAAGIRPNVELGRRARLTVNRGIVVNDDMETSSPDIFAVGECVEHNGICYGQRL